MKLSRQKKYPPVPAGVASIIVTIIISLTLVAIVGGLTALALSQTRQSSAVDQSSRAINAAQAGVSALVSQVNDNPSFTQPTCNNGAGEQAISSKAATGGTQDIAISCATVTNNGPVPEGYLDRDQSVVFDLSTARDYDSATSTTGQYDGVSTMQLQWNLRGTDAALADIDHPPASGNDTIQFPPLNVPGGGLAHATAAMELTFAWCPKTVPAPTNNLQTTQCTYSPGWLNNPPNPTNPGFNGLPVFSTTAVPWLPNKDASITSNCGRIANPTAYDCHIPASGSSSICSPNCLGGVLLNNLLGLGPTMERNYNLFLKLTARYAGTHYSISFGGLNASGGQSRLIDFPYSIIDVTARSGDVYRRVIATKNTHFSTYDVTSYALFSGGGICKNLYVYQTPAGGAVPGETPGKNNCATNAQEP